MRATRPRTPSARAAKTGGVVTVKSPGVVGVGAVSARGGSGRTLGGGGAGGTVTIVGRRA